VMQPRCSGMACGRQTEIQFCGHCSSTAATREVKGGVDAKTSINRRMPCDEKPKNWWTCPDF